MYQLPFYIDTIADMLEHINVLGDGVVGLLSWFVAIPWTDHSL